MGGAARVRVAVGMGHTGSGSSNSGSLWQGRAPWGLMVS